MTCVTSFDFSRECRQKCFSQCEHCIKSNTSLFHWKEKLGATRKLQIPRFPVNGIETYLTLARYAKRKVRSGGFYSLCTCILIGLRRPCSICRTLKSKLLAVFIRMPVWCRCRKSYVTGGIFSSSCVWRHSSAVTSLWFLDLCQTLQLSVVAWRYYTHANISLYLFVTVTRTWTMNGRFQRATKRTVVIVRHEQHAKFVWLNCVTSYHLLYDCVLACARGFDVLAWFTGFTWFSGFVA